MSEAQAKTKLVLYTQNGKFYIGYRTIKGTERLLQCLGNVGTRIQQSLVIHRS